MSSENDSQLSPRNDFEQSAGQHGSPSLILEMWDFLKHNKKWWLGPIVVILLLFGFLLLLSGTAAAPFIYTLF